MYQKLKHVCTESPANFIWSYTCSRQTPKEKNAGMIYFNEMTFPVRDPCRNLSASIHRSRANRSGAGSPVPPGWSTWPSREAVVSIPVKIARTGTEQGQQWWCGAVTLRVGCTWDPSPSSQCKPLLLMPAGAGWIPRAAAGSEDRSAARGITDAPIQSQHSHHIAHQLCSHQALQKESLLSCFFHGMAEPDRNYWAPQHFLFSHMWDASGQPAPIQNQENPAGGFAP